MAIRFFSPRNPDLYLASVPVKFSGGIAEVDDPQQIERLKYLGIPYGVTWVDPGTSRGSADASSPAEVPTGDLLAQIRDPSSPLGAVLRELFEEKRPGGRRSTEGSEE